MIKLRSYYISVPDIKQWKNILGQKNFTVSMADAEHAVEANYYGIVSANTEHSKLEKAGLHTFQSEHVHALLNGRFLLALECRMKSYAHDTERLRRNRQCECG